MAKTKETKEETSAQNSLHRSSNNKIIAGVAGGLGEYFNIDATIIRIIFVLLAFLNGTGLLIYVILWIVMPSDESSLKDPKDHIRENVEDLKEHASRFAHDLKLNRSSQRDSKFVIGGVLIVLGIIFFLNTLGIFAGYNLDRLWPIILIVLGLLLLSRRSNG